MLPAMGVTSANFVWIGLAASGAAALASQFPTAFLVVKLAGLAFICWLAINLVRSAPRELRLSRDAMPKRSSLFVRGIGLQLANPNALVFFGALLPGFFDADHPLLPQILVIMATITVSEMFGLAVYAAAADRLATRFRDPVFARWFNVFAALLMAGSAAFAVWTTSQS